MKLSGLNLGGWLSQVDEFNATHLDTFIIKKDFERIKHWGFNSVRLPVDSVFFFVPVKSSKFREDRLKYIDKALQWAQEEGLIVILDLHKAPGHSFDIREAHYNDIENETSIHHQQFLDIWEMLSKRYKNQSNILYEVLNEPVFADNRLWMNLVEKTIKTIRQNDSEHYIVVESNLWGHSSTFKQMQKFQDKNIMYSFHYYQPLLVTHQLAEWLSFIKNPKFYKSWNYPGLITDTKGFKEEIAKINTLHTIMAENIEQYWDINALESVIKPVLEFSQKNSVPVLCGEFGCIAKGLPETREKWIKDLMVIFKKHQISYSYWSYKNMDFGIYDNSKAYQTNPNYNKDRLDEKTLKALQQLLF